MTGAPFESDASRAPERAAAMTSALTAWRRELSTLGGPNTLLWYADQPGGALELTTAHPGGVSMLLAGRAARLSDLVRERAAFAQARARAIEIRGRTVELASQRGLETGFLAAGMATWDQPRGARPLAPVLLRSCTLRPTDPAASDFDVVLGDEVEFNPVLEQYLRSAAGLEIDTASLADMATLTTGFDPYPVYAALSRLCSGLPGFTVSQRLLIGTFPHGKLALVADLAELSQPAGVERLTGHPVIAALASGAGSDDRVDDAASSDLDPDPDPAGERLVLDADSSDLDPDPDPAGERLVLDADSAQSGVVEAALRGDDLVVHAPPGTGTTQTVANLVAALVSQGSTVLLAAQHQVETRDVRTRLESVGLTSLVLDPAEVLFDHRRTVRRVVDLIENGPGALAGPGSSADADARPVGERLQAYRSNRDELRDHVAALHQVRVPWGVTVYEAQCAIAELGSRSPSPVSRVRIRGAALARLSRERLHELAAELTEAVGVGAWSAGEAGDPWYGARITFQDDAAKAGEIVTRLAGGVFDERANALDAILAESSLPPAKTVDDWRTTLTTMTGVRDTLEVFRPEIFDIPLDEHVAATARREDRRSQGTELGPWTRSRVRRLATRLLRPGRPPQDLHAELVRAQHQRAAWHALVGAGGRPEISPRLDEAQAAYDAVDADLSWLGERLATTAAGGDLHRTPVRELRGRLAALAARPERLAVLPRVVPVIDDLRAAGMGEVVDDFAARGVLAAEVTPELEHIWWVSIVQHVADADPHYGNHDGARLREAAAGFAANDHEQLRSAARRTLDEVSARHAGAVRGNPAQAATLRAEASRQARPIALRTAFQSSSDLLLRVAPCWAMSPLAVAEAIPPGQWFDVVVVMGAGNVTSAACVSALSRARQVVAFGDPRTAGPTGFVVGPAAGHAEGAGPTPASLLDDLSAVLPVHRLRWAHGYADERLVDLANRTGYAGALVTVPGCVEPSPVTLELVDGRAEVEPGQETTIDSTDAEVARVVDLVLAHARNRADETLGVITVTERHADRVRSALAEAVARLDRVGDRESLAFLDVDRPRPVYVVPMGHAASRSRDAVIVAVGYGKTPHGRVLHRFPALSSPDAGRSLTTMLTSARAHLTVVSSIGPQDLDPARLRHGAVLLHDLLTSAAAGTQRERATAPHLDPLMDNLAQRLRREGFVVAENVGLGRRTVELAVADPKVDGRWLVAVEADGPQYASWRGTRERDLLWPEELERLGWQHLRIWSTDLYRDPAREVARVVGVVREAAHSHARMPERAVAPEAAVHPVEAPTAVAAKPPGADAGEPAAAADDSAAGGATSNAPAGEPAAAADDSAAVVTAAPGAAATEPTLAAAPAQPTEPRKRRRPFRRGAPDQSTDDMPTGWGERPDDRAHDQWLQEQRPPHWD